MTYILKLVGTDKLGLSVSDVSRVTETFAKTLAISGQEHNKQKLAILQFSQALASGVIHGDEFNSVAENAPAAMDAFSRALGVSKGELRKLAAEGMLTTDILISALQEQSSVVDDLASRTQKKTIGQAQQAQKLNDCIRWSIGCLQVQVIRLCRHWRVLVIG